MNNQKNEFIHEFLEKIKALPLWESLQASLEHCEKEEWKLSELREVQKKIKEYHKCLK